MDKEIIIVQTKKWIVDVVIGCNFCPFAAREIKRNSIHFEVIENATKTTVAEKLLATFIAMDSDNNMETAFMILPQNFDSFAAYLKLINASEALLKKSGYEGVYQVASFHPAYVFAGASLNDPANYTNRSPYPMIHILREESVSRAVDSYPDTNMIPQKNIAFANGKGLAYMQALRDACMKMED
jgi:uncharacterized protein